MLGYVFIYNTVVDVLHGLAFVISHDFIL